MIQTFADQGTADIHHAVNSKAARKSLPPALWGIAMDLMDQLDHSAKPEDMRIPPGNRLKRLKGSALWSVRINDQFRLVFRFEQGHAWDVQVIDYH